MTMPDGWTEDMRHLMTLAGDYGEALCRLKSGDPPAFDAVIQAGASLRAAVKALVDERDDLRRQLLAGAHDDR
jgi:hypothetical protein